MEEYCNNLAQKNFEDLDMANKYIEQNKELLQRLRECNDKYNQSVLNGNAERNAVSILKLQYESRIKELEAEVRELRKVEVK